MTFNIHITHRHVEGAGLNNEYYERIDPCDDYIDHDVDDEQVRDDTVTMIYNDYFQDSVSSVCQIGYYALLRNRIKEQIKQLLVDLDVLDYAVDMHKDELREKYEEEYNRG